MRTASSHCLNRGAAVERDLSEISVSRSTRCRFHIYISRDLCGGICAFEVLQCEGIERCKTRRCMALNPSGDFCDL